MRRTLMILALLWVTPAWAGAWLRAEGTGFLASSLLQDENGRTDAALYFEYGVRPKLTLGVKADADMTAGRLGDGTAFAFDRLPIPTADKPFKLTYDLGIGATLGAETDPLLRTGLSYGRGLNWRERSGWLALDLAVEWSLGGAAHTTKFDTTIGMGLTDTTKLMMQVFVSNADSRTTVTLAPSLIWQPRESKRSYQVGVEAERGVVSVRLGLWQDF
ncbi:hypothetical protein [Tateyamaria sp. SN6-1]|uniref:hypothetical protein n=1 Tax=Tateyamaria sp. SN6-1 TaxID=3092148 RepID=UPI0039F5006B